MAHIALIAYELENGGISRVAIYLANGFAKAGHCVSLVVCTSAGERDKDFRARLDDAVGYVALSNRHFGSRALGQIRCFLPFRRWLRHARPDAILGTSNNISWFAGLGASAANDIGAHLYIKTTNPIIRENDGVFVTAIRRFGYNLLFARAKAVLTLSNAESEILNREFPERKGTFRAVFNPYLTDALLANSERPRDHQSKEPRLLAAGRLTRQKNMGRLIEAFALACERDAARGGKLLGHATLVIAGDGPELEALKAQTQRSNVAAQIEFLGFCDDIAGQLGIADLFVLSSNYEGLPAVVIEALGSHCPVVSTDCFPAAKELLGDVPGCCVTDRTAEALAAGILSALSSSAHSPALRERALNYSIDSAITSHLNAMEL